MQDSLLECFVQKTCSTDLLSREEWARVRVWCDGHTERLRAIAAEDPEGEVFADLADEHMGELLQRLEDPARSTFTGAWCELYGPPDCPFDNPCD